MPSRAVHRPLFCPGFPSAACAAIAAALVLNRREEADYLEALLSRRPDLTGLPFAMKSACRTRGARARAFKGAAEEGRRGKGAALLTEPSGPE